MDIQIMLTVEEVAHRLSVSTETVRRYLRTGKLAGIKLPHEWRVRPAELERFLESLAVAPRPE